MGDLDSLRYLDLADNQLTGGIPPELGNLENLEELRLQANNLTGSIPAELLDLENLKVLYLFKNSLNGPLPPKLGDLSKLRRLWLGGNRLGGPIPPEIGDLDSLRYLDLADNQLTGGIPPELGNLENLEELRLQANNLTGPLPPELGGLENLERLQLFGNSLSGPLPPEFEGLEQLRELTLTGSSNMNGSLPSGLTALEDVRILLAGGTGLCAPRTPDFQEWLRGVYKVRIASCGEGPAAYLTQAVQSRKFPVPLIAGDRALLRVFLTADRMNDEDLPGVTVRLYDDDGEIHSKYVAGKAGPIPMTVDEGDLAKSVNYEVPGEMIREDLEMVVEVDSVDASLGVPRRIPEGGRMAIGVDSMPALVLTAIPFLWTSDPDSSIIDVVSAMSRNPTEHELLQPTRTLLPVAGVEVAAHSPVESSTNSALSMLNRTHAIRVLEGGKGYYMGTMAEPVTVAAGVAFRPGRSSFSIPHSEVIAHELGHNMNLAHAPCGGAGRPDQSYPHDDGVIGAWGWDFETEELLSPGTRDLMSYCEPKWISDYHFTNAARFRLSDDDHEELPGPPPRSLLLWGGVNADGAPFLEPAFVVNAPAALPDSPGDYRLEGLRADGTELFSLNFNMLDVADAEGASGFVFALPAQPGWAGALAGIRLAGSAGSAMIDSETRRPMAILRDRTTGEVRGFLDRLPADVSGFEVHFSRGIPDPEAWH
ncbi:MAG: leucine-rich repeat domain-containing protein [Gemmatimonadetes bacterium]|nr:leucine-rich repeat domain-containing protein [Gemmatimonadota bacterium]